MTRVRLEDLPAKVRAQIEAGNVTAAKAKRKKDRRVASTAGWTYRCHWCPHTTTVWAQAERHSHQPGHGWIEFVLEP